MKTAISVIICTHNPRRDYLGRVLQALKEQTLAMIFWEILLIDNASEKKIASEIDLSWHHQSRCIREEKLGLTHARLRGFKEAESETLVFVDDDNVLNHDYLEVAMKISQNFPMIGAWGGQVIAEFEEEPPEWTKPELKNYLYSLACREFERDSWSNLLHQHETTPCGAGLCVRKVVLKNYADLVDRDPKRIEMDRKGSSLISCGDTDIAFTACDIGLGTGQFTSLKLNHLIPPSRLKEDYLLRLTTGLFYSGTILDYLRGKMPPPANWQSSKLYLLYIRLRYGVRRCRFYAAQQQGIESARKEIQ